MTAKQTLILVLEREEEEGHRIIQVLKDIGLDAEPVQVSWVQSANEALTQLQQTPFDIILLGFSPTQTIDVGLTLLHQMRQVRPDVPIVVLVGSEMMGWGLQAVEFGAYAYFPRHQLALPILRRMIDKAAARADVWREAQAKGVLNDVVFDSLSVYIIVTDEAGLITAVNQEWTELTTIASNPLITQAGVGADLPLLCRQANNQVLARGIEDVLTGSKAKFILEYPWPEGDRLIWYMVCVTPLRWPQGGAVFTCQEVTETISRQIQLSTYKTEITDLKNNFITTVHELRTPLANIHLYLDLIGHAQPEKQQRYLSIVKQETTRLEQYVNDILALARLEEGGNGEQFMQVDFSALVQHVVAIQQPIGVTKGLELTIDADSGPFLMNGCARQLTRVITNLIANAIRYTETGWVRVRLERDTAANRIGLTVSDSGIGIAPEVVPHIFEPFFRSPRAQQMSDAGTGLGLAIVQQIVKDHSGSVSVTSEVDTGSTFQVWLPAADAA
jgi:signal transduction histidine kinase/CheY-like chemotaxis protein